MNKISRVPKSVEPNGGTDYAIAVAKPNGHLGSEWDGTAAEALKFYREKANSVPNDIWSAFLGVSSNREPQP
jgi:hypothetical protein